MHRLAFPILLSFAVALLAAGCGSSTTTASKTTPTRPPVIPTFVVPQGWMDFSADSSRKAMVWLVKRDYKAEIIVENIFDRPGEDFRGTDGDRVEAIAKAIFMIDKGKSGRVVKEPQIRQTGANPRWRYLLQDLAGDDLRVIVGMSDRYGFVRCAASVRSGGDLTDVARVQDALLEGPTQ